MLLRVGTKKAEIPSAYLFVYTLGSVDNQHFGGFCGRKWQMQGKNMSQCRPLASVFNAANAVLWRKSRQNVDCQQTLGITSRQNQNGFGFHQCAAWQRCYANGGAGGVGCGEVLFHHGVEGGEVG